MSAPLEPGIYSDLAPGIHSGIAATTYHADPCPPSLSASIAHLLCSRSPKHAWFEHPKLNPEFEHVDEQKFAVGTVAHALLLDGDDICCVIEAPDWRSKSSKERRDAALAAGLIPLLPHQYVQVQAMVASVRSWLGAMDIDPPLFADGAAEQTLVWEDQGVLCRGRLDWLRDDRVAVDDYKTTAGTAHPGDWSRRVMWSIGADIQARFYQRGVLALTGIEPAFRFVVCETEPPYGVSVVSLAPAAVELADAKVDHALALWRRCLERDEWPGFPAQIAYAEPPAWEMERLYDMREAQEVAA